MPQGSITRNPVDVDWRAIRLAQGLSLTKTARDAGIDPSHLSRIETGLRSPSLEVFRRLAAVLGHRLVLNPNGGRRDAS